MTKKKSRKIKLISFNMLGVPLVPTRMAKRFLQIAREFERLQPDIIALQEVHTARQLRTLVLLLPSYPHVSYKPHVRGPKGGLVVFSKIPIEESAYIRLSYKGAIVGKFIFSKVIRKGVLVCRFKDTSFSLLNTQLSANHDADWSADNRFMPMLRTQMNELKDIVKEYKHLSKNLVVVGDFNIPKDLPIYKVFLKDTGMKDAFAKHSKTSLHLWFFEGWKAPGRIDFIFYFGSSIRVSNPKELFTEKYQITQYFDGYLSDHIALSVDVKEI